MENTCSIIIVVAVDRFSAREMQSTAMRRDGVFVFIIFLNDGWECVYGVRTAVSRLVRLIPMKRAVNERTGIV